MVLLIAIFVLGAVSSTIAFFIKAWYAAPSYPLILSAMRTSGAAVAVIGVSGGVFALVSLVAGALRAGGNLLLLACLSPPFLVLAAIDCLAAIDFVDSWCDFTNHADHDPLRMALSLMVGLAAVLSTSALALLVLFYLTS